MSETKGKDNEEYEIIIDENESSEQLKSKLLQKMNKIKSSLNDLKLNLSENIQKQSSNIPIEYNKYIDKFKNDSKQYVENKEKNISNKEILNLEYSKFIKKIKDLEKFNKNLSNIILNSLQNYNDFLLEKLPYYKELATKFMINQNEKLGNNNIFCKLNNEQIFKLSDKLKNKNILYLFNGKGPLNICIIPSYNLVEGKSLLDSTIRYEINKIELNDFKDDEFKSFFNENNNLDNNKMKQREIIFQNCEFKNIDISAIPFDVNKLIIINSKIYSIIFDKINFNNLTSLILDNNKLDSDNFENILKIIFKKDIDIYNNLKVLSAKNNIISRIIKKEELGKIDNKLKSLEILNLSNNYICDINKKFLDLIPNIQILDLSNNSISQEYKVKELINNCKGLVLLLRNISIMKEHMNNYYKDYYFKKLKQINNSLYSVNLNSLLYKRNYEEILKIDFTNIKKNTNILEINLSSCNIDDKTMIKIISNCASVNNNINKLNLSFNKLTENFFDLLISNHLNLLLCKMTKLILSFNDIHFIGTNKYKSDNARSNQFIIFLNHFPQIELLLLKGTPFEEKINEYIKKEITLYYEIEKKHQNVKPLENEFVEIKNMIEKKYLEVNPKFIFVINDMLSTKYTKRIKQILNPLFFEHIVIDNLKQEEKK